MTVHSLLRSLPGCEPLHQPCGSAPGVITTAPTERPPQIQEDVEAFADAEVAHVVSGGRLVRGIGMLNRACSHHRLSLLHLPDLAKDDDFAGCGLGSPDKGHQVAACNPLRYPSLPSSVRPRCCWGDKTIQHLSFERLWNLPAGLGAVWDVGPGTGVALE